MAESEDQWTSLYVGDLDFKVTEIDLQAAFGRIGPIHSIRVCRCAYTGKSLCYAYVNFHYRHHATKALQHLNHVYLKGKPMRIMWSQRNPFTRKTGIGNLFVKNLHLSIDSAALELIFSKFGSILSCKVVVDENGKSKCFGFVQFDSEESALAARTALHDSVVEGKKLYVSKFIKKSERTVATYFKESQFTSLYVKNLAENMTEDTLLKMFSPFGKVSNVVIMKDCDGKSRGFGFVNFESSEDARKALDALNGSPQGSRTLFVGRAQKKHERTKILHEQRDKFKKNNEKLKTSNLYVKNLSLSINDNELQKLFSVYGKIVSAKVMCYDNGVSKGFGFISFSSPEEAQKALHTLNGMMFEGKCLYVAIAQSKRDRQVALQNYFAQCQTQPLYLPGRNFIPPFYLNFTSYRPPITFMHHPMSYQNFGANMGGQYQFAGRNYQQRFCAYIPMGQMHQSLQSPTAQSHQPHFVKDATSSLQDQDLNHGYAGVQNTGYGKKCSKKGGAPGSAYRMPPVASIAPANSPDNFNEDIGNLLHSLVEKLQPERAGKITGMLLEMSNSDIIKLLKSPNSLALQVDRAAQMLKEANGLKSEDPSAA